MVEWFERVSYRLVLLEEYSLEDIRRAREAFDAAVRRHLQGHVPHIELSVPLPADLSERRTVLRADHAWFAVSLDQLRWFYRIVEGEDHGGHRQALGQYGRVFAEALQRHRVEERGFLAAADRTTAAPVR
jgi:hypothetical protein